jgi:hypothetical protein
VRLARIGSTLQIRVKLTQPSSSRGWDPARNFYAQRQTKRAPPATQFSSRAEIGDEPKNVSSFSVKRRFHRSQTLKISKVSFD